MHPLIQQLGLIREEIYNNVDINKSFLKLIELLKIIKNEQNSSTLRMISLQMNECQDLLIGDYSLENLELFDDLFRIIDVQIAIYIESTLN